MPTLRMVLLMLVLHLVLVLVCRAGMAAPVQANGGVQLLWLNIAESCLQPCPILPAAGNHAAPEYHELHDVPEHAQSVRDHKTHNAPGLQHTAASPASPRRVNNLLQSQHATGGFVYATFVLQCLCSVCSREEYLLAPKVQACAHCVAGAVLRPVVLTLLRVVELAAIITMVSIAATLPPTQVTHACMRHAHASVQPTDISINVRCGGCQVSSTSSISAAGSLGKALARGLCCCESCARGAGRVHSVCMQLQNQSHAHSTSLLAEACDGDVTDRARGHSPWLPRQLEALLSETNGYAA
jgi:hypothetical protein